RPVEHGPARGRKLWIDEEITETLELEALPGACVRERRLERSLDDLERVRIELLIEILAGRKRHAEKPVVKPNLGTSGVRGRDPVDRAFDLPPLLARAAARRRVVAALEL